MLFYIQQLQQPKGLKLKAMQVTTQHHSEQACKVLTYLLTYKKLIYKEIYYPNYVVIMPSL